MHKNIFLSIIFSLLCLAGMAQPCNPQSTTNGSPCSQQTEANPFCTDEHPDGQVFPSGTGDNDANTTFFGVPYHNYIGCLYTSPRPAWYYMQIETPGDLTFHIYQTSGDVDFACWGPFTAASQADFMDQLCCGQYTFENSQHPSNTESGASYPYGNMVDCSYSSAATEWCHISNAQAGQWYLLLLTNYHGSPGTISFTPTGTSTATTNCNLLNSATSNSPICEGATLIFEVTRPHAGATYNWTGPNGFSQSTTNTIIEIPNTTANMSGEYHMTMTGISQNANEAVLHVEIMAKPTPEIIAESESICIGESVLLTAGGDHPSYEYKWSAKPVESGNYTLINGNNSTSIQVNPEISYRYALIATENECMGVDSIDIIVNPLPVIGIAIDKPTLCHGEGTNITASGGSHYNWSNGSTSSTIFVSPEETTNYTVEVLTDALCSGDTTVEIIAYPAILLSHEVIPSYCNQTTGEITMHATGGVGPYTFTAQGATFMDSIANFLHAGVYDITATDNVDCSVNQIVEIPAVPGPTPCFLFASNDDVNMAITNCTQGNNSYFWDFGDGVTSSETHPTHEYMEPGRYSVNMVVVDEHNCSDSLRQDYVINGPVYLANAFSPNGDGINDVIHVIGQTIQKTEFLWVIYDRSGSLVFMSVNPEIGWDGTLTNGKDAIPGVYTYRLKYKDVNGNHFERDGNITLIR